MIIYSYRVRDKENDHIVCDINLNNEIEGFVQNYKYYDVSLTVISVQE